MLSPILVRRLTEIFGFIALGLVLAVTAFAQVDTGAISGTVKDTSGGVIPGVKVTIANEDTGLSVSTTSGSAGEYVFSPVKIGRYSVSAETKGFQKVQQKNVTVDVQQRVVVDFTLAPGQTMETVVVNAAPPVLQTQDASVGQVIGERTVDALPLNGRNYIFLAQLSAGVTQGQQDTRGLGGSGSFAANGLRPAQNNYLLDGIDNNVELVDFLNGTHFVVRPPVDAIQEFKIQTNSFSAEFGRSAVVIPHLYHGTDKTFFFFDYEGTRTRQAVPYTSTVPTALERSSGYTNLSELLTQGGTQTDVLGRSTP